MTDPCVPGDAEWHRRLALALADDGPTQWWWLSFADTSRTTGSQFLGLAIVPAPNVGAAAVVAHLWDCNPGGEVAAFALPGTPRSEFVGRLFTGAAAHVLADLPPEDLFVEAAS